MKTHKCIVYCSCNAVPTNPRDDFPGYFLKGYVPGRMSCLTAVWVKQGEEGLGLVLCTLVIYRFSFRY